MNDNGSQPPSGAEKKKLRPLWTALICVLCAVGALMALTVLNNLFGWFEVRPF